MTDDELDGNDVFILSWDQEGLESCINATELDRKRMWDILADQQGSGRGHDLNSIVSAIMLRARFNSQRHYEVYSVVADGAVTEQDLRDLFEQDPQGAAELIRERGRCLHSDRRAKQKVLIT
jgi:hypothetical protein